MTVATRVKAVLLLGLSLMAFVGSDGWFAILADESEFVTLARQPLPQTVDDYLYGDGQPEHAPLAGVLLHAWLPIGGHAQWSLRLPSIVFYLAGLVGFALVARSLAGDAAFVCLLWIGVLWPLGFHFGRLADWYSLCFFLVAVITLAYLRYLERPSGPRFAAFLIAAILLVYATYYGWAIVGCLAIDFTLVRRHRESLKFASITLGTLALAYLPLWRVFADQVLWSAIRSADRLDSTWLLFRTLHTLNYSYVLFVSESMAPWFWYASIPVSVGIAASLVLMLLLLPQQHRRYLIYFALLFGGMVMLDIVNNVRLLHISGWLLLAFALALANTEKPVQRRALALVLASVSAVGWTGVLARNYYAAPQLVEPWTAIAADAANMVKMGGVVVSNSPSFLFMMNYALYDLGLVRASSVPGWVEHPAVVSVNQWSTTNIAGKSPVLFVKGVKTIVIANGVNSSWEVESDRAETWLAANCLIGEVRQLVPDTGYAVKARFNPNAAQQHFRISLKEYDCSGATAR